MSSAGPHSPSDAGSGRCFATTRWSIVLAAQQSEAAASQTALATLCETYWFPLYGYVRRQGYQPAEAQDLTQAYFARLLEKRDLQDVGRDRGKFRSFLLVSLKHFLSNQRDHRNAAKRGGKRRLLSLDFDRAEQRLEHELADRRTPEMEFDRQWALTLIDQVRTTLQGQWQSVGKAEQFARLESCLSGAPSAVSYRELGEAMRTTEGAVKVAVHRLRQRFGQLLREEIAQTVGTSGEIDDEIRQLFNALRG